MFTVFFLPYFFKTLLTLIFNIKGAFFGLYLSINRFKLLKSGQDKHSCLPHTRLGLAQHIHGEDCLGDALVLN